MATYKVIQDIEAEDKLVGPLTLRQFVYAGIAATCSYFSFLSVTKHAAFMLVIFLPVALFTGFFAFPWGRDQPTELWALAKIRFLLKPRRRIWDQSGVKELVTITVPKKVEQILTDGLDQTEVKSRLHALADTIDSRGWAIKNVNVNLSVQPAAVLPSSDRLVDASAFPQEVSSIDVRASDDILDESANPVAQHFNDMMNASAQTKRQQLMAQLQDSATAVTQPAPTGPPNNYWFLQQPTPVPGQATFVDTPVVAPGVEPITPAIPHAATPTAEEQAMVEKFKAESHGQSAVYGRMKTVLTPEELAEAAASRPTPAPAKPTVTPQDQAAIMNLAQNDDLDVATIARQAHKQQDDDNEVVISFR